MSAEGVVSVFTGGPEGCASNAEGAAGICQHGRQRSLSSICAMSVEEAASVSTGSSAISARSVEGAASISTGDPAVCARSVEVPILLCHAICPSRHFYGIWGENRKIGCNKE